MGHGESSTGTSTLPSRRSSSSMTSSTPVWPCHSVRARGSAPRSGSVGSTIRSLSAGSITPSTSALAPNSTTGSSSALEVSHPQRLSNDVGPRPPFAIATSRRGHSAATGLLVPIHHHLCRLSDPTTTGLGAFRLTDPAQVLVLVRWGRTANILSAISFSDSTSNSSAGMPVRSSLIASPLAD